MSDMTTELETLRTEIMENTKELATVLRRLEVLERQMGDTDGRVTRHDTTKADDFHDSVEVQAKAS